MTHFALAIPWEPPDATQYAALSFLARYRATRCAPASRTCVRSSAGAPSMPSSRCRRSARTWSCTCAGWSSAAWPPPRLADAPRPSPASTGTPVIDGHCEKDPSLAVTRPRVPWEGQRRTVLHPLEYAALLTAAHATVRGSHALVALLGMIGLRISEATNITITGLRSQSGYELLTILGKGAKPALIPLPVPVLRAVRDVAEGRGAGPLLLNRHGERLSPAAAAGRLRRLAKTAGLTQQLSHTRCAGRSAPQAW